MDNLVEVGRCLRPLAGSIGLKVRIVGIGTALIAGFGTPSLAQSPLAQFLAPPETMRAPFQYTGVLRGQLPGQPISIRSEPLVTADVVAQGFIGNVVEVVGQTRQRDGIWFEVKQSELQRGWVRQDYLRPANLQQEGAFDFYQQTAVLGLAPEWATIAQINVRLVPSLDGQVIYGAEAGDRVRILGESKGEDGYLWYYVSLASNGRGWIRGDAVRVEPPRF